MARFFDRVMEHGISPPTDVKGISPYLKNEFYNATVVDLSNVAHYYYAGTDQEHWVIARDFPAIRSPFDTAWYEFSHNGFVRSAEIGDHWESPVTVGFLVRVMERGDYVQAFGVDIVKSYQERLGGPDLPAKWIQEALMFVQDRKGGPARGPLAAWRQPIQEDGSSCVKHDAEEQAVYDVISFVGDSDERRANFLKAAEAIIYPVLLGLSFMHTKNIEEVTHEPPDKVNYKRVKKGKPPLTVYKTLELKLPGGKRTRDFTAGGNDSYGKKLHLVRGHFRDYTKERPLFGKHVGRWFWNQHMHGAVETGEVKKDYKTSARAAEEWAKKAKAGIEG